MDNTTIKLSEELDILINLYCKKPTAENKENMEKKRIELYEAL